MGCLRVFEHPLIPRLCKPTQKTTETNTSADTVGAKQKVGKRIKIGSLNIQNIRGNTIFAQSVMKETEILFIQEHWLFMVFCWTVTLVGVSVYMVVDNYCFVFGTGYSNRNSMPFCM
jgi:hypothetical protein